MAPSPTAAQTPASAPARRRGRPGHDREAVLRAAIDLFIEQGYDATSISDLAGSLGVTKSAVYHHFPSKESLLGAALDEDDPERRKMILYSSFFTRTLWSMTYAAQSQAQCFECMRVCPVGAERRDLK